MNIFKTKTSNKTIALMSWVFVLIYAMLTAGAFRVLPTTWGIFSPLGVGIFTLLGAIVLMVDTFGRKPNMSKDLSAQINVGFSIVMALFGVIVWMGNISLDGMWLGVLAVAYAITTILLLRELIFN